MKFTSYNDECIDLGVDLVNTENRHKGTDELDSLQALEDFIVAHRVSHPEPVTEADLGAVKEVRERLRAAFEAPDTDAAAAAVNDVLEASGAHPYLSSHDGNPWHFHYTPADAPLAQHVAAEAAMGLGVVLADGGFDRLQVCEGEKCLDVFVDRSKNRSRRFCSPEICGNRASVKAYRRRRQEEAPH